MCAVRVAEQGISRMSSWLIWGYCFQYDSSRIGEALLLRDVTRGVFLIEVCS
jgi:hypothetical protein